MKDNINYRMLAEEHYSGKVVDWNSVLPVQTASLDRLADLEHLPKKQEKVMLDKLVVCKLNGGLGTSMGCVGPKSAMVVRRRKSFLDLIVEQIRAEKSRVGGSPLLMLMNSFYTDKDTHEIIKNYKQDLDIQSFLQNKRPRIRKDTFTALSAKEYGDEAFYPPGHGDFYQCFQEQGILDRLIQEGREYVFVSNSDNLGATVDLRIPAYMKAKGLEFLCEVAVRTRAHIKGGIFIQSPNGSPRLLEIAQVLDEHRQDFENITKFGVFNTNNVWIHLPALKRVMSKKGGLHQDLILNNKTVDGIDVMQIETALASSISSFTASTCLLVERSRFLPVKKTDDLFMVRSDLFEEVDGMLKVSSKRHSQELPLVRLGKHLESASEMERHVPQIPSIIDLELLTVLGDVYFGRNMRLVNRVLINCTHDTLHLPDGCTLNNQALTGVLQKAEL